MLIHMMLTDVAHAIECIISVKLNQQITSHIDGQPSCFAPRNGHLATHYAIIDWMPVLLMIYL
jgi:hypothetical protein